VAALTTSQKAPLTVTTESGTLVASVNRTFTLSSGAPFHIQNVGGGEGTDYVVADSVGTGTVTVSFAGQTGSLELDIAEAPLLVGLGAPEAK
jgi:hypothetical protein